MRLATLTRTCLRKMRICFVCPNILPLLGIRADGGFGGAEIQIRQIAHYLTMQGAKVDILVSTELGPSPRMVQGFRLVPAVENTSSAGLVSSIHAKLKLLRALRYSRADVYVSTCAAPDAGLIAIYARLFRKPFVYRVSSDLDCDGTSESQHGWRGRLFGLGLRSADVVVAQHASQSAQLSSRGIRSSVIRNSFEVRERPATTRDIDVLWVGRSEPLKRPRLFIDIARKLPDRRFVMICAVKRGQEQLSNELHSSAKALPNTTFIEGVSFSDVKAYYERSRVFAGTSESEGFPNTYIEACLAGTPIASLDVDPERFIQSNDCGFVAHGDFGALVEGIERLLKDPSGWERRSRNARAYARRMHSLDVEGTKWARLLRSLRKTGVSADRRDTDIAKPNELV